MFLPVNVLVVLAAAIFPYTIVVNAISKFNNLGKPRQIIVIGSIHVIVFLAAFVLLVPTYGTLGAGYSILIASIASAVTSIIWSDWWDTVHIHISCVDCIWNSAGYAVRLIFGSSVHPFFHCSAILSFRRRYSNFWFKGYLPQRDTIDGQRPTKIATISP